MDSETRDMLLDTAGRFFTDRCGKDVVNNVELNQPSPDQLNELANQAAMDAANAAAAAQANMHAEEQNATLNVDNPSDAEEQNVSGM